MFSHLSDGLWVCLPPGLSLAYPPGWAVAKLVFLCEAHSSVAENGWPEETVVWAGHLLQPVWRDVLSPMASLVIVTSVPV